MNSKPIILLILVTGCFFCYSQPDTSQINHSIQDIKSKLSSYKKVEKVNTEHGTRYVFFKDNELKLIAVKSLEPNIEKNVEWYYINGQVAYIETDWLDPKTNRNVFNEKHYFKNGHLVAWIDSRNKPIDPSSDEFRKMDSDLSAYCIKIKDDALRK